MVPLLSFTADPERAKVEKSAREPPGIARRVPSTIQAQLGSVAGWKTPVLAFQSEQISQAISLFRDWDRGSMKGFLKGHIMEMEQQTAQNPIHQRKSRSSTNRNLE